MTLDLDRPHVMRLLAGSTRRGLWGLVWGIVLCWVCTGPPARTYATPGAATTAVIALDSGAASLMAPGVSGRIHRFVSRTERAIRRLGLTLVRTASVWFGMIASALACLVVIGFASVADRRMLDLRRHGLGDTVRDLLLGLRTFARILRDRRTPASARALVVAAVVYWMLPTDVLADVLPGYGGIDDLLVAILAAKGFVALCPEAVITDNAVVARR